MNFIKNILALIGLLALIAGGYGYVKFGEDYKIFKSLDPKAGEVYWDMWQNLKVSRVTAQATVWRTPFDEGVTKEDAEESMKLVANEMNMKIVGELPLSEQVFAETGEPQLYLKIFEFCDARTARLMVNYNTYISAYLPCRVSMVEEEPGKFALYSMNMDMILHGGESLPPELYKKANRVKTIIQAVMAKGAAGDF